MPPNAKARQFTDPLVTAGAGVLRFEGFSACASAWIRADFSPEAYSGSIVSHGTTNVDFNPPMRQALARAGRLGTRVAVGFIDVDHFKAVNDTLGHESGDLLLRQVAQRLESCVREGDLLARLGGDEFVVLIEGQDGPHSMAQKILEVLRPDYDLNGQVTKVTASIGISRFPQDGVELNGLLSAADFAMYQAKTAGRDSVQFYKSQG